MTAMALLVIPIALTIHSDFGGYVLDYAEKAEAYREQEIRIMGTCASACTLYLGNPRVCVGPHARLIFHAPYGKGSRYALIYMMRTYPKPIRDWIARQGGLTRKQITLRGKQLKQLVRGCA